MAKTWFEMRNEVPHPDHPLPGPTLWLQWGTYHYANGESQDGYRFIWTRADGSIQSRGPARIPAIVDIEVLIALARHQGWGSNQDE
jgi:hypothetical protein